LALLNRPPTDKLEGHPPPMTVTHPTKSLEELYAAASKNSPTLQRDQKMIERSQLSLNLARKDFYPDYTITGGYFNMGSMPDMYQLQVSFKLPTSFSRKQRPAVAEQVALGSQARSNMRADSQSLAYRIKDEYLTWQTSNRLAKLYADTVVPQSNLTLESSLASYQAGTVDFLTVMMNFISILEYEMNYHEEMLNGHLAAARLEELTGVELTHEVAK
jgi:outer membrane protein TolC